MNQCFSFDSSRRSVARQHSATCISLMQTSRCSPHLGASQDSRAGRPSEKLNKGALAWQEFSRGFSGLSYSVRLRVLR
ncbi:hypothetical protein CKQ90_16310 [Klebsiella pneumoniae]|nr:hypothetical protein CKQ90_16310 [Klebsiella pneumoniae]